MNSVLSVQLFHKPKTILKNKMYFKDKERTMLYRPGEINLEDPALPLQMPREGIWAQK